MEILYNIKQMEKDFRDTLDILLLNYKCKGVNQKELEKIKNTYEKLFKEDPYETIAKIRAYINLYEEIEARNNSIREELKKDTEDKRKRKKAVAEMKAATSDAVAEGLIRYENWKQSEAFAKKLLSEKYY